MTIHLHMNCLYMNQFYAYPVINKVVVLIKIIEKNEKHKDVTENQHTVRVQTQKGICGTVLTVQYLPSGTHKIMIMFSLQQLL